MATRPNLARGLQDPLALPGVLTLAAFLFYAVKGGGYAATIWYPGALLFLCLAALALPVYAGRGRNIDRSILAVLAVFALFTAWNYLSISWAEAKGEAWDGANRTLLYLIVFGFFALLPWSTRGIVALFGAFGLSLAVLALVEVVRASLASHPESYFQLGRFAAPTNYQNATCALLMLALWPSLLLASRRELPILLRGIATAACAVLLEAGLLCQSRASLVAVPLTLGIYLVLVPGRARTLLFLVPPALAVVYARTRLLDVFSAFRDKDHVLASIVSARYAMLVSSAVCLVLGCALAVLDRTVVSASVRQGARRGVAGLGLLALVGVVALAVANVSHPIARAQSAWKSFKVTQPTSGKSYFSSGLGGNRYDVWRVAIDEFRRTPVIGGGADNFAADYLQARRSQEEPEYPHSLELRVLAETGLVGGVLFAALVGGVLFACRGLRKLDPFARAAAGMGLAVCAYWAIHGSVDWLWELPALGGPAFASLGLAVGSIRRAAPGNGEPVRRRVPRPVRVAGIAVAVTAAAITFVLPWLAAAEVDRAASAWRSDPAAAFANLALARRLNLLSDTPSLIEGAIAARLNDRARMTRAFTAALERNPKNWYAEFELAVAAASSGRRKAALGHLAKARRLDPREPTIQTLDDDIRAGRKITPSGLDQVFLTRIGA